MKSNLRSFRDDSSLSRSKTTESDFQKIPMSEQQQIAMLRQMSNTSSKGRPFLLEGLLTGPEDYNASLKLR